MERNKNVQTGKEDFALPLTVINALELLNRAGYEAYLVGGSVRDFIMGKMPGDYDIATSALPEETKAVFRAAGFRTLDTGIRHGTVTALMPQKSRCEKKEKNKPVPGEEAREERKKNLSDEILFGRNIPCPVKEKNISEENTSYEALEITTFRTDGSYRDHRHPDGVSFTRSLEEDVKRRDFTMNALAMDKTGKIIDFVGGRESIRKGEIKCVGEPEKRFEEDALRILRALRFSATLGFVIGENTAKAIHEAGRSGKHAVMALSTAEKKPEEGDTSENGPEVGKLYGFEKTLTPEFHRIVEKSCGLDYVSGERIRVELLKLLAGKDAERVLCEYPDVFGALFSELLPEMGYEQKGAKHRYDVWKHTAHVVGGVNFATPEMRRFSERLVGCSFGQKPDEPPVSGAENKSLNGPVRKASGDRCETGEYTGIPKSTEMPADDVLLLAALFHDIGKPAVGRIKEDGTHDFRNHGKAGAEIAAKALERLKPDRETYRKTVELIGVHDAKLKAEKPEIKRWLNRLGEEGWLRFLRLKSADQHGLNESYWGEEDLLELYRLTDEILKKKEPYRIPDLAVTGDDLIRAGIRPGKEVGEALSRLLDEIIGERIPNEKEALLTFVRREV